MRKSGINKRLSGIQASGTIVMMIAAGLAAQSAFAFGPWGSDTEYWPNVPVAEANTPASLDVVMNELALIRNHLGISNQPAGTAQANPQQCDGTMTEMGCMRNYDASFMFQGGVNYANFGNGVSSGWVNMTSGEVYQNWIQAALASAVLSPIQHIHFHQNYYYPPMQMVWNGSARQDKLEEKILNSERDEELEAAEAAADASEKPLKGLIAI